VREEGKGTRCSGREGVGGWGEKEGKGKWKRYSGSRREGGPAGEEGTNRLPYLVKLLPCLW
jgi:hypothetical protein